MLSFFSFFHSILSLFRAGSILRKFLVWWCFPFLSLSSASSAFFGDSSVLLTIFYFFWIKFSLFCSTFSTVFFSWDARLKSTTWLNKSFLQLLLKQRQHGEWQTLRWDYFADIIKFFVSISVWTKGGKGERTKLVRRHHQQVSVLQKIQLTEAHWQQLERGTTKS